MAFVQVRRSTQLPVLTMVTGYSRWLSAVLISTRTSEDLFAGWWSLIEASGAVPRLLFWDEEGATGLYRREEPELTRDCQGFRGTLGIKVFVRNPADPAARPGGQGGIIERLGTVALTLDVEGLVHRFIADPHALVVRNSRGKPRWICSGLQCPAPASLSSRSPAAAAAKSRT